MARKFSKQSRPRTKAVRQPGRPAGPVERTTFAQKLPRLPQYAKRRVRMLQKVDVSKGITMPEANNLTTVAGVNPMGNTTTRTIHQQPAAGPASNRGKRVVAPPRTGGGVLRVFNSVRRVGR